MGVFLRVFDPKGFRNPYKGSDWREVGRQRVEPVEEVRAHRVRNELYPTNTHVPPQTQASVSPLGAGQDINGVETEKETELEEANKTTIEKAEEPSDLEKEITEEREFYGPGEITGIASDLMIQNIPSIKSTTPISEVAEILKKHELSHLPVLTEQNTICGLITENQIFIQLVEARKTKEELNKSKVKELMISPVLCCLMETPITTLIQTIIEEKVGFIPVIDSKDQIRGVVTKNALLRYIFESPHFFNK